MRSSTQYDVFEQGEDGGSILWVENPDTIGIWEFSFDKRTVFNMFEDYPWKLTSAQKAQFDLENPFWAEYFKDRV